MSQFKEMYVCKCPCSVPRLLLYFHLAVWAHVRGHNPRALAHPHTLNYARRIFTVEPITSSIDSCWGAVLCCSCWYFNYRGNLSKSPRLLASTLTRHLSRNQYCSSQPGCSRRRRTTQELSKQRRCRVGHARLCRTAKELSHQRGATAGGGPQAECS